MAGDDDDDEEGREDTKAADSLTRALEVSQISAAYRNGKVRPCYIELGKVEIQLFALLSATVQVC